MEFAQLVSRTRSYRRFRQTPISEAILRDLVDLARLSPSGGNVQPLKFMLSNAPEMNERIFPQTLWAGYLKDWPGPAEGERPTAYVIILHDTEVASSPGVDHGIAAQSIVLGAMERGIGACMIGSIKRDRLRRELALPERYEILLIVALGEPGETVVLEETGADGSIRYYRDEAGRHHVPKRPLDELILDSARG